MFSLLFAAVPAAPSVPPADVWGPWAVVALVLMYLFKELQALKRRVRALESLEVLVERFRNFYAIVRENLDVSVGYHRAGEHPTELQLEQWERLPSLQELQTPAPPFPDQQRVNAWRRRIAESRRDGPSE